MKASATKSLQAGCCALAIAVLPTSCAYKTTEVHERDPMTSTSTTSVTTYRPGYVAQTLPSGYETRVVGGTTYYTAGGTYFRPHSSGYVVVESP